MSEHISKVFDQDLEGARAHVMAMGGLVEEQFRDAIATIGNNDQELIAKVLEVETQVNGFHMDIDNECVHIIARRQPAAGDLRMVLTVIKVINDLERIGDKAVKIVRRARQLAENGRINIPRMSDLTYQAELARSMLHTALDGFARMDPNVAVQVAREDVRLDEEFNAIQRQLITFMMEDPRTITLSLEIIEIAKAIERVGDHAKNIAEYVVYLVKGKDVRHSSVETLEREVKE